MGPTDVLNARLRGLEDLLEAEWAQCPRRVLLLAPFASDKAQSVREAAIAKGLDVTYKCVYRNSLTEYKCQDPGIALSDFTAWGKYSAVFLMGHAGHHDRTEKDGSVTNYNVFWTTIPYSRDRHQADVVAYRMVVGASNGIGMGLLHGWLATYAGDLGGAFVQIAGCNTEALPHPGATESQFAAAFRTLHASAYGGFEAKAREEDLEMINSGATEHLGARKTVGTLPRSYTWLNNEPNYKLSVFDASAGLPGKCWKLASHKILITYSWPAGFSDLDTTTAFVGETVGWACCDDCGGRGPWVVGFMTQPRGDDVSGRQRVSGCGRGCRTACRPDA